MPKWQQIRAGRFVNGDARKAHDRDATRKKVQLEGFLGEPKHAAFHQSAPKKAIPSLALRLHGEQRKPQRDRANKPPDCIDEPCETSAIAMVARRAAGQANALTDPLGIHFNLTKRCRVAEFVMEKLIRIPPGKIQNLLEMDGRDCQPKL